MGIWKLPKTAGEAEQLKDILSQKLRADQAMDVLYGVLGSDDLFDRLSSAKKAHPGWDVRSLVVNAVAEIYFTGQASSEIASPITIDILRDIVDVRYEDNSDIFFAIAKASNSEDAMAHAAWALEIKSKDFDKWTMVRDHQNLDFIALGPAGDLYRVNASDGLVMDIDAEHADSYRELFHSAPSASM